MNYSAQNKPELYVNLPFISVRKLLDQTVLDLLCYVTLVPGLMPMFLQ